jgi:hypothetical protein
MAKMGEPRLAMPQLRVKLVRVYDGGEIWIVELGGVRTIAANKVAPSQSKSKPPACRPLGAALLNYRWPHALTPLAMGL